MGRRVFSDGLSIPFRHARREWSVDLELVACLYLVSASPLRGVCVELCLTAWRGLWIVPAQQRNHMKLNPPLCITPSLLPGVRIADRHETSWVQIDSPKAGESGLVIVVTMPDGQDVRSDRFNPRESTMEGKMEAAISFLSASGESYRYRMHKGETEIDPDSNEGLFPAPVPEWAYRFSDEILLLQMDLQEAMRVEA